AFMARLGITVQLQQQPKKMASKTTLMDWLFGKAEDQPEPTAEELGALKTQLGDAKTQIDARLSGLQTQIEEFKTQVQTLKSDAEKLRADIELHQTELAELKKQPAATHTAGEGNPPQPNDPKAYDIDPVTVK